MTLNTFNNNTANYYNIENYCNTENDNNKNDNTENYCNTKNDNRFISNDSASIIIKNIKNNLEHIENLENIDKFSYNKLKKIIFVMLNQVETQLHEIKNLELYLTNNYDPYKNYKKQQIIYNNKILKLEKEIDDLKKESEYKPNTCSVCLTETSNYINTTCGHLCVCEACSYQLDNKCPICRQDGTFIKMINC